MDFTEAGLKAASILFFPAQLKRSATAPAVWAAAMDVPVFLVMGRDRSSSENWEEAFARPGPYTLTPGAASSGLITPVQEKPLLEWM